MKRHKIIEGGRPLSAERPLRSCCLSTEDRIFTYGLEIGGLKRKGAHMQSYRTWKVMLEDASWRKGPEFNHHNWSLG